MVLWMEYFDINIFVLNMWYALSLFGWQYDLITFYMILWHFFRVIQQLLLCDLSINTSLFYLFKWIHLFVMLWHIFTYRNEESLLFVELYLVDLHAQLNTCFLLMCQSLSTPNAANQYLVFMNFYNLTCLNVPSHFLLQLPNSLP